MGKGQHILLLIERKSEDPHLLFFGGGQTAVCSTRAIVDIFFFLEHAGELRIIILRRKKESNCRYQSCIVNECTFFERYCTDVDVIWLVCLTHLKKFAKCSKSDYSKNLACNQFSLCCLVNGGGD
jgi:hypothetical protein